MTTSPAVYESIWSVYSDQYERVALVALLLEQRDRRVELRLRELVDVVDAEVGLLRHRCSAASAM